MKFKVAEKTENFSLLRFVSEGGRWEVGLVPMLFGVRVRAGICGCDGCELDYCAGDDPVFQLALLDTVMKIMQTIPEDIDTWTFVSFWPGFRIKPINRDPTCWKELLAMREKAERKLLQQVAA